MDAFETKLYTAVLITAIVLGGIMIYFAIAIFRNHRKYLKLHNAQFLIEHDLLEKERTRIARDLHDELGPLLCVTRIQIGNANEEFNEKNLSLACENIEKMGERLKGISQNLTPNVLLRYGLGVALDEFISQVRNITRIRIFYHYNVVNQLDEYPALHIYRMVQEMINNGIKHSRADYIKIILVERKRQVYVSYKDDGVGFNEKSKQGIGFGSLRNRAWMLGGQLEFNSNGHGTEYFFSIPIKRTNEKPDNSSDR